MESTSQHRFHLERQSSLAPEQDGGGLLVSGGDDELELLGEEIDPGGRVMYMANEGDLKGIKEALDLDMTIVNFQDTDGHTTALHIATCQGHGGVVHLLLCRGAQVDIKDHW